MWFAAPLWVLFFAISLIQWRIFGLITGQALFGSLPFMQMSKNTWWFWTWVSFGIVVGSSPCYEALQRAFHIYWRRSMRCSFFAEGKDIAMEETQNEYCPNLIVGSILNDFRRPTDTGRHSLFEISSYLCGGRRVGWLRTPRYLMLGRCVAISAAAVDGFLMYRNDLLSRWLIWALSFLSGDWVVWPGSHDRGSLGSLLGFKAINFVKVLDALPGNALLLTAFGLFLRASQVHEVMWASPDGSCEPRDGGLTIAGLVLFFTVLLCSYFTYAPMLSWLRCSPIVRQFQMLAKQHAWGLQPPKEVYVTDPGPIECLGLHHLLLRRARRILAFEATETGILHIRSIIERCWELNGCSLFDPENPRRDVRFRVDEFERSLADATTPQEFLHLGIYYETGEVGDLVVVLMRQEDPTQRVRGTLTRHELGLCADDEDVASFAESGHSFTRPQLRGCCCTCCHAWAPIGAFPMIPTYNQCITPVQASELARLAYELTGPALKHLVEAQQT